jgi:lipopolysaccharide assembly outer membrane protein LptD (OstA)
MDATVTGTGYTTQGFLVDAEFRQRFENGTHTLRIAGINQMSPGTFSPAPAMPEAISRGVCRRRRIPDQSALDVRLGRHGAERQQFRLHLQSQGSQRFDAHQSGLSDRSR